MKAPSKEQLLADVLSDLTWKEIAEKYGYSDPRFLRKLANRYELPKRRKILKPSESELRRMILDEGLTPYQVADKLGYGEGGWSNIYAYCREYGIEFDFSQNYQLRAVPFSPRQKDIALASVLGDGYLRPSGSGYALSFTHGEKQLDYLRWKLNEFENFVATPQFYQRESASGLGHAPTYSFSTITHPYLSELHDLCYANGRKRVTSTWLDQLSDLSLAVWYMDDGSINRRYGTIVLCTNAIDEAGQLLIIDHFRSRYGLEIKRELRRRGQYVLRVNASQRVQFLEIVAPHIPDCMSYKLG